MRTDEFYAWLLATKEMTREDFDALTEEEKAALDVEFGAIEAELDDEGSPDVIGDITVEDSEEFFGWLGAVYELNEEAFLALPIEEQQAYRDEYELSKAEPEPVQAKGKKFPKRDSSGEIVRCNQIKAAFGDDPAFCRRAIAAGWNVKRAVKIFDAQVKAKRQRRSNVPVTAGSSGPMGGGNKRDIAVVSLARTFGITDDRVCDKFFGKDKRRFESAVKAAISRGCYDGGYSLNDLYLDAINSTARKLTEPLLNEARLVAFRNRQSVAGRPGAVKASLGFSTIDGDEVLTGVMQAYLEERWAAYELQYPQVAKEREVANFRDIEGYRTTLMGRIGQIAANGQIPMLGLDIEKTVSKALPQGATFAVPKMHYIDDDIGLFQDIADQIADVSWQSLESDVFEMLRLMMAGEVNASDGLPFFSVDRGNMITGATSSLSVTGLGLVKAAFAKLRNKNGQPIAFKPDRLVVPPALEDIAERIYTSTESMAPDPNGSRQVYYNQYRPVSTPYLGSSNDTGNISDLAWVLMLDPERFPVIAVQKLRGYTTPVIEQSDMDLAVWGTKFRTLFPYGVTPGFPEAAVLATGEA